MNAPLNPAHTLALAAIARGWEPKHPLTVSEWADANRILSLIGSAAPGEWKTSRTPYLREIMDQLSEQSSARLIVLMAASQIGKTEAASNWLGYIMAHAKGPVAVVMPTEKSLNDWASQKFDPMAAETPAVARVLSKRTNSGGENSAARKRFVGGILYFKTAGSTAELKSTSLRYAIADEVDEYDWSTTQGDPLGLLEVRLTTFHDRKLFAASSPTLKDASRIEEMFEAGDQRRYHVACPHCNELQALAWGNIVIGKKPDNPRRVTDAWYVCRECGSVIYEHQKTDLLKEAGHGGRARWIAANPTASYPSYHINALYAPLGLGLSWRELAAEWMDAQDDPAKLMRFMNTRLGETWADRSRDLKPNILAARAEPYLLRTVPQGCLVLTAGVDTQDDRLEIHILGHGQGDITWTLDYHVLHGNPADDALWQKLADYLNAVVFQNARGRMLKLEATAIDTGGHHTHSVYEFARSGRVRRVLATKGASTPGRSILGKPSHQDVKRNGQTTRRGVALYLVGADTAKHLLYNRLDGDDARPPNERKVRFSQQLEPWFYDQLVSETFNPRKNRWEKKKGKRNEVLDTWILGVAASHHPELYLHKWRKSDWDRRRLMLEPDVPESAEEGDHDIIVPATAEPAAATETAPPIPATPDAAARAFAAMLAARKNRHGERR